MTTDRHERHDDPRLTAAYRDLAREQTPAALDEAVLRRAAREARTPYGLARAWTRPAAWAAMIGLSLAVVLELSRLEEQTLPSAGDSVPAAAPEAEPRVRTAPRAEVEAAPKAEPAPAQAPAKRSERAAESVDLDGTDEAAAQSDFLARPSRAVTLTGLATAADDADGREQKESARSCDEEARSTPADWHACIVAMRNAGSADAADRELDALQKAFPDFRMPDESR